MGRIRHRISIAEVCVHLAGGTADDFLRLTRAFGRRTDWLRLSPPSWRRAGLAPGLVGRLAPLADGRAAADELARCKGAGFRLVPHRDPTFPAPLRLLTRPPVLLVVTGRWPLVGPAVGMVGARAATPYGRTVTSRLARTAAGEGIAVVSGLARGVDRFALEAALEAGGWPVGVLGCGLDIVYPAEHRRLQPEIARAGTLISEFPLGTHPSKTTFPRRNRIIAALSDKLLVVEAGVRSGALITAGYAMDLGKDVLAVPGPIDSVQSMGTNRLLADGATPIIDGLSWREQLQLPGRGGESGAPAHPLLAVLGSRALTADELASEAHEPVRSVRSALIALEIEGLVQTFPGMRYAAQGPRPR